jgi:hypothetical protein
LSQEKSNQPTTMSLTSLRFAATHRDAFTVGDHTVLYFPFLHDLRVTVVALQWFDFGYDDKMFVRNQDDKVIFSENEDDIIELINKTYKPEQIDPKYCNFPEPDKLAEAMLKIKTYEV